MRVSGTGPVKGDEFERQELAIRAYAKAHDVRIMTMFREEGVRGTKERTHRPALADLIAALRSDRVKLVLVESLGRLARDLMIQESILHDLKRHGFELISIQEPDLCGDDPSRKFMRQIMGAFHEYEKTMIVGKLRGATQRSKTKAGHCDSCKPYGFYDGEAVALERMKALRASNMGYDRIAEILNEEGFKPRTGERWWGKTVNSILGPAWRRHIRG